MSSDWSENKRRASGSHRSIVPGESSRRSRSRTRARGSRHSLRSTATHRTETRDFEQRRSRRSPSRVESQARSRNRSVIVPMSQSRTSRASANNAQGHESTSRIINRSRSKHRSRTLRTPRRKSPSRARIVDRPCSNERFTTLMPQPSSMDHVNNELLKTIKESLQSISAVNSKSNERFNNNNVVPEFDPKLKNQTIVTWLNKVKECSDIYGWDTKQTAHYALPKLVGTAKKWYEGQPSVLLTWDEWAEKLKSAFPSYENYGHVLTEMLAKRAKFGDDLEEYYYDKLIALNRCGIVGRNAIDCIVYGIDDRSVRYGAEAVGFEDVDKLLGYLRGVKHERVDKFNKKPVRSVTETMRKPIKSEFSRIAKCFNCHETGHVVSGCKKPIVTCHKCKRIGHDDPVCNRSVWVPKSDVKTL